LAVSSQVFQTITTSLWGEIPWSPEFADSPYIAELEELYRGAVHVVGKPPIEVEVLTHRYAWERYHSDLNQAGGIVVP